MILAPTLNVNGTYAGTLVDGFLEAARAIEAAYNRVVETVPNGRDYQTAPVGSLRIAIEQHEARLRLLRQVYDDMLSLADAVAVQRAERERGGAR